MERAGQITAELSVSDYSQLGSLVDYLGLAVPEVRLGRAPGRAGRGEQGALDVVTLAADSSVLVALVNVLPTFLRSRKAALTVTLTVKGRKLTVTADNADDMLPILERFLDD